MYLFTSLGNREEILQTMYSIPRFLPLPLPLHLPGSCLEHPKSASLATPASVTRTFAPLISLDDAVKIRNKKKTWEKKKWISKEVEKWKNKKSKIRSETGNLDKYRFMNCDQNLNSDLSKLPFDDDVPFNTNLFSIFVAMLKVLALQIL